MLKLMHDHMAPSEAALGAQNGGLIPCPRSKQHPHFPNGEDCNWCPPPPPGYGEHYHRYLTVVDPGWAPRPNLAPWADLTARERRTWDCEAEAAIATWAAWSSGSLPDWHPDYKPVVDTDEPMTWGVFP